MGNIKILEQLLGKSVYLDSNIFIYAVEQPIHIEKYSLFIRELFAYIDEGKITAITSELTLSEVLAGAYSKFPELISIYEELIKNSDFLQVHVVDREILKHSAKLRSVSKIALADAIHVATAIENQATAIITNDKKMQLPDELIKITLSDIE